MSYYDPTRSVVVDGMHNIFEGLVQFHCREILGLDRPEAEKAEIQVDPRKLKAARETWKRNPTRAHLKRLSIPILSMLCSDNELDLPEAEPGKPIRKQAILDLLEAFLVSVIYAELTMSDIMYSRNNLA